MSSEDRLAAWLKDIYFKIMLLEDVALLEYAEVDVDLDYSGDSLRELERFVLDCFGDARVQTVSSSGPWEYMEGAAAYLGEVLMRLAGGSWDWVPDDDPEDYPDGVLLVRPDAALGLDPVSPLDVLMDAVRIGDGKQLTALYRSWELAVQRTKQERPSWRPVKGGTMLDSPEPGSDHLTGWLAQRREAFPGWMVIYAPGGVWDFSPNSLPALEDLVRWVAPTAAGLHDPANRGFRDGAAWYLGEVMRRGMGGRWNYDDRLSDSPHNFEYVEDLGPSKSESIPVIALERALDEPGFLRSHFDNFAS